MPGLLRRKRGRDPPVAAPLPILRAERSAIADLGTHHIEQLAGNHLLARLVVLYRQFLRQLGIAIVRAVCSAAFESSSIVNIFRLSTCGTSVRITSSRDGSTM